MPKYRVFVERPVYERGYYVIEAPDVDGALTQAKALFEVKDPSNMEAHGGFESELLGRDYVEELEDGDEGEEAESD